MQPRRIAVGTTDGASLCDHLARSLEFVVFEVEGGQPASRTVRSRESAECGNHRTFVEMLDGCDAVICGGIGRGAFDSLTMHGIQPVVAAGKHSIEEALRLYLEGTLPTTTEMVCLC